MNTPATPRFGILTMATPNDVLKAIGLALSLRVSNPGVPLAVACAPKLRPLVEPHFNHVIDEQAGLKGFVHKVHLDRYSPFDETLFLDSDVLVFKPVQPYIEQWGPQDYTACGRYMSDGHSAFGMDRASVLRKLGKPKLVVIDGAGHAYFRKPGCVRVFELARHITAHHHEYMGAIPYADEDVMDAAMTQLDLPPMPHGSFFSRHSSARRGSLSMDATQAHCRYVAVSSGQVTEPCMMHFAANEAALSYHYQLHRLFRQFGVAAPGLWRQAASDFYDREIHLRLHDLKKRLLGRALA